MSESNRRLAVVYLTDYNALKRAVRRLQEQVKDLYEVIEENLIEDLSIPDLDD